MWLSQVDTRCEDGGSASIAETDGVTRGTSPGSVFGVRGAELNDLGSPASRRTLSAIAFEVMKSGDYRVFRKRAAQFAIL